MSETADARPRFIKMMARSEKLLRSNDKREHPRDRPRGVWHTMLAAKANKALIMVDELPHAPHPEALAYAVARLKAIEKIAQTDPPCRSIEHPPTPIDEAVLADLDRIAEHIKPLFQEDALNHDRAFD